MKFNITEEEKNNILKMYNFLLSEQSQKSPIGVTTSEKVNCNELSLKQDFKNSWEQVRFDVNGNGKINNLEITSYPNPTNSQFGSFSFETIWPMMKAAEGKVEITCSAKNSSSNTYYLTTYVPGQKPKLNPNKSTMNTTTKMAGVVGGWCFKLNQCYSKPQQT